MKNVLLLSALFLCFNAHSFETGLYHGESADGTQVCDINLMQNANSLLLKELKCLNHELNYTMELDGPTEISFGHVEGDDDGFHFEIDGSSVNYHAKFQEIGGPVAFTENLDSLENGNLHYEFKLGGLYPTFNLILAK
jgi:hypothetical protein